MSQLCGGFLDDLAALVRSVAAVRGSSPAREPPRERAFGGHHQFQGRQVRGAFFFLSLTVWLIPVYEP